MEQHNFRRRTTGPENQYLTSLSHSLILKSIKHGSTLRLHPYEWNETTGRMERSSNKARLAVWYLNVVLPIVYFGFVMFRAVQTFQDDTASPRDKILGGFGVVFYIFPAMFQLTYFFYGDEYPGLVNQSLKLLSDMNTELPPVNLGPHQRYPVEVRYAEFFTCIAYYGFHFMGVVVQIFAFELPGTKFLVSSLHEDPQDLWNPYRLLSWTCLVYITENYIIGSWAIFVGIGTLSFPLCVALEALRERHLTPETMHYYRCLQLWVTKFNRIYSGLFLPTCQIMLVALATLGVVGVIRFPGVIGLVVGTAGLIAYSILYLLLRFYGTIDKRSRAAMERWRFEARGTSARQLRTLRPISILIGSYCFIDRCLILTATNLIVNNSITLLLAE